MTDDNVQETTGNEQKTRIHPNQVIASLLATLTLTLCGLCFAWPRIFFDDKQRDIPLHGDDKLLIDIALPIGACIGPILSGLLINHLGRKWFLYVITLPILACWIITFFAKFWVYLLAGRLVAGISVGAIYTVVPLYNGEITEPKIRGAAVAIMHLFFNLGHLFSDAVGPLLKRKEWTIVNLVAVAIFGLTFIWMPESPYYYLKWKQQKNAELSLTWLRGKTDNEKEINEMKTFVENEEKGSIKRVFTVPINRRALVILMLLLAGQQLSGLLAIRSYAKFILPSININLNIGEVFIIMAAATVVASLITTLVVDKIGRKLIFLLSAYGVTVTLLAAGSYCFLRERGMKLDDLSWLPLVIIIAHCVFFSFGLGSIPAIVSSEIFPINVKHWATMIANIFSFAIALIVAGCYRLMIDAWSYYTVFFIFAGLQLVTAIATTVLMPETSRKSFAEIQEILKERTSTGKNEPSESSTDVMKELEANETQSA